MFIPVNGGGQIYPTLTAISLTPIPYLAQFKASSSKPTLLLSFVFASSCPSLYTPMIFSKHTYHPPQHMPIPSHSIYKALLRKKNIIKNFFVKRIIFFFSLLFTSLFTECSTLKFKKFLFM